MVNQKYRSTAYKGNQYMVSDGVVDAPKSNDQAIYKLLDSVHAMKLQASSQQNNRDNSRDNSRYNYRNPQERRTFTKISRPCEDVLKILVDSKILTLIEKWQPPPVKGPHWDDNTYCKYHQIKTSHTAKNCQRLKHDI